MTRARDIKLIHIAKASLGMSEDTYRDVLARYGKGKTSSKDLNDTQLSLVLRHMKSCGFKVQPRAGQPVADQDPQQLLMRRLWWSLADAGAVERPTNAAACDAALNTWAVARFAEHQPPLSHLRFASVDQARELIEQLKQWAIRVGADFRIAGRPAAASAAAPVTHG